MLISKTIGRVWRIPGDGADSKPPCQSNESQLTQFSLLSTASLLNSTLNKFLFHSLPFSGIGSGQWARGRVGPLTFFDRGAHP